MPTIVSNGGGATASIGLAEDRRGVTRVTAIDPNPVTITYSIVGGADQSLFQIGASNGLLSFVGVPDFEAPADADHDNAYVVQVRASNGVQSVDQAITVNVIDINDVTGGPGADVLAGGPGGDVLDGFAGADSLTGNTGADQFLVSAPGDGVDILQDFWSGTDKIGLDQIGFGIAGNGGLAVNGVKYVIGTSATANAPTIIVNPSNFTISWDADGTGAGAPVTFARLDMGSTVVWAGSRVIGTHDPAYQVAAIGDFNHDGNTDVLWRNSTTGQVESWQMANGIWQQSNNLGTHGDFQIVGIGDFNHDGTNDVLWRNNTTGLTDIWLLQNGNYAGSVSPGTHGGNYQVASVADVNHDGNSDVVWIDPTTGNVDVWLLANGAWTASVNLGSHDPSYQIAAVVDVNHDGNSDVVWRNPTTGQVEVWLLVNGAWSASVSLGSHAPSYQIVGVGDFNNDGSNDVLWRNPTTGQDEAWLLVNGNWAASVDFGTLNPDERVVGIVDFDGDGRSEVLWRNVNTGAVHEWILAQRPLPGAGDFSFEGSIVPAVSIPVDTNAAANSVVEGNPAGTAAGLTASSTNPSGDPVTYSLSDSAGGRFAIDPGTGVVTIANAGLVNFETAPGHAYNVTVVATSGTLTSSRVFSIDVGDVAPGTPTDNNGGTNTIAEGATTGAPVGVTIQAPDVNGGPLTYSFADLGGGVIGDAGGRFQINTVTGVVSVSAAGAASIDYETAPGHAYAITVQATDGLLTSVTQTFSIAVTNVAPDVPIDNNGVSGGTIAEGAGTGALVGITAFSTDPGGTTITYSLVDDAGGRFTINSGTGVVSVTAFGASNIDYETTAPSHVYSIIVRASDSSGAVNDHADQTFTIAVTNVAPSAPGDGDTVTPNGITEGAAVGAYTGFSAFSTDPNTAPGTVVYTLTDDAGGRFEITTANKFTGEVTVTTFGATNIDYETATGHAYNVTIQADDGQGGISSSTVAIPVIDAAPSNFTDNNAGGDTVVEGAANGTAVGVTAHAVDPNGGAVHYSIVGGDPDGAFTINSSTGVITVADGTKIDFETTLGTVPPHSFTLTVEAADDAGAFNTQDYVIDVTNAAPSTPTDDEAPTGGSVVEGALAGATVGITAASTDPGDPVGSSAVSYTLTNSAGGLFTINSTTGVVTVTAAGQTGIDFETSGGTFGITVDAFDGTSHVAQNFSIVVQNAPPSQPVELDGTTANDVVSKSPIANTGDQVGITLSSTDPNNGATITYSLTDDAGVTQDAGGLFSVDAGGVVRVADNTQLNTANVGDSFTIWARAFDGTDFGAAQSFTISVVSNNLTLDLNGPGGAPNGGTGFAATFTEQSTAVAIADTDDFISNTGTPGADTIVSATIVLTDAKPGDLLDVSTVPGGFSPVVTPGAGTITVTLAGSHTFAQYSAALQQIKFSTSGNAPDTSDRHISVTVNDGSTNSNTAVTTITVESVNDAPVLSLTPATAVSYAENDGPLAFFTTGSVTDPDLPANFLNGSYKVEITSNADTGDQIVLLGASGFSASGANIIFGGNTIGTISSGALGTASVTITLTAFATPSVVSQLADAFAFHSSSENPSQLDRTVRFTFNDGANSQTDGSAALESFVDQTVHVTAINDAPVNTVPAGPLAVTANQNFAISGLSVSDVDSAGLTETVQLSANHGNLNVVLSGTTIVGGANGTHTLTLSGTIANLQATLANNVTYHGDSGFTGSDTLTVTADDAGHSPSGALQDIDTVAINVTSSGNLDAQLWYVTRESPTAGDNVVGYINSDGTHPPVHYFSTGADSENDLGVDTAAGFYFVVNPLGTSPGNPPALESHSTANGALLDSLDVGVALDAVDAVAVDTINHVLFVAVPGDGTTTNGILKVDYDPSTGNLTGDFTDTGDFLLTTTTAAAYSHAVDFSIDLANHLLYYVDQDGATSTNGIFVVDYTSGTPTPLLLSNATDFPVDGSNGFIQALAVDNLGDLDPTNDIIYLLTSDNLGAGKLWYIDRGSATPTAATELTSVTLTLTGEGPHTGLAFDPVSHHLFISDQDTAANADRVVEVSTDLTGNTVTLVGFYTLTDLTGQATPDNATIPGALTLDVLPSLAVVDTAFTEGTPQTLDVALTALDPEGYLRGATIVTAGGFAGDGDLLTYNAAFAALIGITATNSAVGGNVTLTFSGYGTAADYQTLLRSVAFDSGDNPTNFGDTNSTRTILWHLDDGAAGDPHSTVNTKTTTLTITPVNDPPTLDLNSADGPGLTGYTAGYTVNGIPVAIAGANVNIVDADDTNMVSATVILTTGDASDALTFNGALPVGILGSIGPLVGGPVGGTITVSLTGSATKAAYDQALSQIQFSTADASPTPAARSIDVVVNDGPDDSNHATSTITVSSNPAPIAKDDADSAIEAGGVNNGTAGSDAAGNVITGVGTAGGPGNADTDPPPGPTAITVVAVATKAEGDVGSTPGTVGSALTGLYGTLTLNSDGSYTYLLDNTNTTVQGLRLSGQTLTDSFNYTIQDALGASNTASDGGAQTNSIATLAITIAGANDNPVAVADSADATEKGGASGNAGSGGVDPTGNVLNNDTDVDAPNSVNPAANGETKAVAGVAIGVQAGPLTLNTGSDVTGSFGKINIAAGGLYTYTVDNTNATVQALRTSAQTLTDTFSYTVTDAAGATSTTQIVVTIHGQNDNPTANNDAANAQEQGGTLNGSGGFDSSGNVLTGLGGSHSTAVADTDPDSAANGETQTVQGVEAGSHPSDVVTTGVGSAVAGTYGSLTINANGSFSYTLNNSASNVQALTAADHPTDVFTYTIKDLAGVTSTALVTVTVDGANDAPVANNDGTYVVLENRTTSPVTAPGLLANDTDVDAGASLTAVKNTDTVHGGVITVNANGTFSVAYAAGNNYLGTDTFTYHSNDGSLNSGAATVTLDVQPKIWYINKDSASATEDGSLANPWKSIANFNAANAAASDKPDIVYLQYGNAGGTGVYSTADGINLANGQTLLGQGVDLQYTKSDATVVTVLDADNTKIPTIQLTAAGQGVTLAQNNTLKGFHIDTGTQTGAIGIEDSNLAGANGSVGTLTINSGVDITGQGKAIDIDQGGTLNVTLASVTSGSNASNTSGSTTEGIQLSGISGTNTIGGSFTVTGATSITNAETAGIQVSTTATNASFNFGTSTSVTDSAIGSGHNGNGIDLSTGIGNTNGFSFGNLAVTTDGGFGLKAVSVAGANTSALSFGATNSINATGGAAVDITSTTLSGATFGTVSSSGSADYGINLVNQTNGTFTASGGTIGTANLAGVHISGGTAAASIADAINSSNGNAVDISGHTTGQIDLTGTINHTSGGDKGIIVSGNTGGTINFTGQTTIGSTTANGVDLTTNTGATINFNAGGSGLDITTTTGTGFNATGGGTVTVQGSNNSITSGSGTDVNIANTTIGGSGVTFQSIAHNGNNSAIILNNTGSGTFTVTGTGTTAGSGGTIQNIVGSDGITLNTTGGLVTLKNMIIQNISASTDASDAINTRSGIDGIQGQAVNAGLTVDNTTFQNISDSGINGSVGGAGVPSATSWNGLTVTNSTFTNMGRFNVANKGDATNEAGIYMLGIKGNVVITGNQFSNDPSGLLFTTDTSGTLDMTATGNTFTTMYKDIGTQEMGLVGISVTQAGSLNSIIRIGDKDDANPALGNTFTNGGGVAALIVNTTSTATGSTKVEVNQNTSTVTDHTSAGTSGGSSSYNFPQGGFLLSPQGSGNYEAIVSHNTFDQVMHANGALGQLSIFTSNGTAEFIIQNNTFNKPWDAPVQIKASADIDGSSTTQVLMQNNTYITGTVGNSGTDVGGPTPFDPNYFQALNGGRLDLTIKNENIPANDPSSGFSRGFYAQTTSAGDILNLFLQNDKSTSGYELKASTGTTFNLFRNGSASGTAQGVLADNGNTGGGGNPNLSPPTVVLSGAGTVTLSNTAPVLPNITVALIAALGGVDGSSPGETQLSQAELNAAVQSGIQHWIAAGISADQLNVLQHVTYEVGPVPGGWLGASTPGHVSISADAAGYGWFIDPTPNDNFEFGNVVSATQAFTDPDQAAAGHMDLLTTVMHEMGVQLGLSDAYDPAASSDLMFVELTAGERRLPDAVDVLQTQQMQAADSAQVAEAALPAGAAAPQGTTIVPGTNADDTFHISSGGAIVAGGGGADTFIFDVSVLSTPSAPVTHIADYSAAQGDTFDFSAMLASPGAAFTDVRTVEDVSNAFATLQVQVADAAGIRWISLALLDGVHAGDAVNVLLDPAHVAHLHAGLLG